MTTIGPVTIQGPAEYRRRGYNVTVVGLISAADIFNSLRELFAKAEAGSKVHDDIPGSRPIGEDLTAGSVNTHYCDWTQGTTGKPQDGWYLLRSFEFSDDETPEGHDYVFRAVLFFMGTDAYYQPAFRVNNSEDVENDWDI